MVPDCSTTKVRKNPRGGLRSMVMYASTDLSGGKRPAAIRELRTERASNSEASPPTGRMSKKIRASSAECRSSLGDPGLEIILPRGERLPPTWVSGHVVARAGRVAATDQRVANVNGKPGEIFPRSSSIGAAGIGIGIGIDQCVVLVGLEGLLAASLAAQYHPTIGKRRGP